MTTAVAEPAIESIETMLVCEAYLCVAQSPEYEMHECRQCATTVCEEHWSFEDLCCSCDNDRWFCEQCGNEAFAGDQQFWCGYCSETYCFTCFNEDHEHEDEGDEDDARPAVNSNAPWIERGITVDLDSETNSYDWQKVWPIDRTLNPVEAMADYYLLDLIKHSVDCGAGSDELRVLAVIATERSDQLVTRYDSGFVNYAEMAIGGELRHHFAPLRRSRRSAWIQWARIRNAVGHQALLDAAAMFREFGTSGVGGEPWAVAAELLHARVTGRLRAWEWVDRVFTLQHNGGSFLNKIQWGAGTDEAGSNDECTSEHCDLELIRSYLGPAHAATDIGWEILVSCASGPVRKLFSEWWIARNKARRGTSLPMEPKPQPIHACSDRYSHAHPLHQAYHRAAEVVPGSGPDDFDQWLPVHHWLGPSYDPAHSTWYQVFHERGARVAPRPEHCEQLAAAATLAHFSHIVEFLRRPERAILSLEDYEEVLADVDEFVTSRRRPHTEELIAT